jgi:hypothetical protein
MKPDTMLRIFQVKVITLYGEEWVVIACPTGATISSITIQIMEDPVVAKKPARKTARKAVKKTTRKVAAKKVPRIVAAKKVQRSNARTPARKAPPRNTVTASGRGGWLWPGVAVGVFVVVLGISVAIGFSDGGAIDVATTINDRKSTATEAERADLASVPVTQSEPVRRRPALVPTTDVDPDIPPPAPKPAATSTATSTAASTDTAATTTAPVTPDSEVDGSVDEVSEDSGPVADNEVADPAVEESTEEPLPLADEIGS